MAANYRVVQRLQAALKQQSGGLLGLANLFKTFDTDNSGSLSWEEFCSALQKCGLTPSPQDIRAIFLDLDKDGDNSISYKEFIQIMRGDLSNVRKALIKRVFESIDRDNDGFVSMSDIGRCYIPKNHPDVKAGRVTVNNHLKSFFDTLTQVSDTGYLSLSQFMEYYANSAAFDDDIKFTENMNSLWNLTAAPTTAGPVGATLKTYAGQSVSALSSSVGGVLVEADSTTQQHLEQLRAQLRARGARGFVGLQRKFRIIDDDNSKTINLVEFKKAVKECGLNLTDLQLSQMFAVFDQDRNGVISYDEFLTAARVRLQLHY
jgi:Ca2+-binding EF-hand superfamily protein